MVCLWWSFCNLTELMLKVEAAWALTNVSAGTTEETSVVVEVGGMNVLVDLMKSKKSILREQVSDCCEFL